VLETGCVSLAVSSKCWLQGLLAVRVCELWDLQDAAGLPTIRWCMLIIGYIVAAGSSHMSAVLASSSSGQNGWMLMDLHCLQALYTEHYVPKRAR